MKLPWLYARTSNISFFLSRIYSEISNDPEIYGTFVLSEKFTVYYYFGTSGFRSRVLRPTRKQGVLYTIYAFAFFRFMNRNFAKFLIIPTSDFIIIIFKKKNFFFNY